MESRLRDSATELVVSCAWFTLWLALGKWDYDRRKGQRLAGEAAALVVEDLDRQARLRVEEATARRLLAGVAL